MGGRDQPGFKYSVTGLDRFFYIQGTNQPVFGGSDRQIDYWNLPGHGLRAIIGWFAAVAESLPFFGTAVVGATLDDCYFWE